MEVSKIDTKYVEAVVGNWIRHNTKAKDGFFFITRDLFQGIELDYDNKKHYRLVMSVIHDWRRQAPIFYETLALQSKLNGGGVYNNQNFSVFLKDFNDLGAYFLWHTQKKTVDDEIVYGFYQPTDSEEKIKVDYRRSVRLIGHLRNRLVDMIRFKECLPSGLPTKKAYDALGRYEQTYLLQEKNE